MEGQNGKESIGQESTTLRKTKSLKHHCEWSEFNYQEPPILSNECVESLLEIQSEKKDAMELYKALYVKFYKELTSYREIVLGNCSNFSFMLTFLNGKYHEKAVDVLNTYTRNPGFFHYDGKFTCNYEKALALIPKKEQSEVFHKPMFGQND